MTPTNVGDLQQEWSHQFDGPLREDPVVSSAGVHVVSVGGGQRTLSTHSVVDGVTLWAQAGPVGRGMGGPWVVGDRVAAGWYAVQPGVGGEGHTPTYDIATGEPGDEIGAGVIMAVRDDWVVTLQETWTGPGPTGTTTYEHYRNLRDPSQNVTRVGDVPYHTTLGAERLFSAQRGSVWAEDWPGGDTNLWETFIAGGSVSFPVLDADETTVYVAGAEGVHALDGATGEIRWSTSLTSAGGTPSLADGILYVPTAGGQLVALAAGGCGAATCSPLWTGSVGTTANPRQPAVAGGVVYTAWTDGSIHAFPAAGCGVASCVPIWSTSTGSAAITGGPVTAGGQLYVSTADNRLVAYGLP